MSKYFENWELHKLKWQFGIKIEYKHSDCKKWYVHCDLPSWLDSCDYRIEDKTKDGINIEEFLDILDDGREVKPNSVYFSNQGLEMVIHLIKSHGLDYIKELELDTTPTPYKYEDYASMPWEKALRRKDDNKVIVSIYGVSPTHVMINEFGSFEFVKVPEYWEKANGEELAHVPVVKPRPVKVKAEKVEPKLPETEEEYRKFQGECGIKEGDKVKVVGKCNNDEGGWSNVWNKLMDQTIGMIGKVTNVLGNGIQLSIDDDSWSYPYFVLEKVSEEPKKKITRNSPPYKVDKQLKLMNYTKEEIIDFYNKNGLKATADELKVYTQTFRKWLDNEV